MSVVKRAIARLNALKQGADQLIDEDEFWSGLPLVENDGDMPSARSLVRSAAEEYVKRSKQPVSISRGSPKR